MFVVIHPLHEWFVTLLLSGCLENISSPDVQLISGSNNLFAHICTGTPKSWIIFFLDPCIPPRIHIRRVTKLVLIYTYDLSNYRWINSVCINIFCMTLTGLLLKLCTFWRNRPHRYVSYFLFFIYCRHSVLTYYGILVMRMICCYLSLIKYQNNADIISISWEIII
jgi:hypothetical protein